MCNVTPAQGMQNMMQSRLPPQPMQSCLTSSNVAHPQLDTLSMYPFESDYTSTRSYGASGPITSSSCGGLVAFGHRFHYEEEKKEKKSAENDISGGRRHIRRKTTFPAEDDFSAFFCRFWTTYSVRPTLVLSTTGLSPLHMPK